MVMSAEALARRNVWILTIAQALGASGPPIIFSLGGIVGQILAPNPALVTLPISLYSFGLALGTLPAAAIMRRNGRRTGYLIGATLGLIAGLMASYGIVLASFLVFCLGTFLAGFYGSYVQSYRFAAADAATGSFKAKAISWVMIGGLIAAVIGPQLVIWTRDAFPQAPFAGSFLSQAGLALLAIPVLLLLRTQEAVPAPGPTSPKGKGGRSLREILATPRFVIAVAAGMVSYGLMTFVMTAAPIAMVGCGFTIGEAAFGIQWHVLAMFAPSFFTGNLIARFGKEKITALGLLMIVTAGITALSGLTLAHFYGALILLGFGWNFAFIGATAMVTDCHTAEERSRGQGLNDFLVFGSVACASFFSGALLNAAGWQTINRLIFPIVALMLVPILWQMKAAESAAARASTRAKDA